MDVEAYFYRDTCTIGLQGHPEYKGYDDFTKWSFDLLNQFVLENPDVDLINRYRRIKPDLLKERKALKEYKTMKESNRSEEHTSELQSLMRITYAVFCLKKKTKHNISKQK